MWFWIKHLSLAFILIAAAAYFLLSDGPIYRKSEKSNSAASGLSQFYANLRTSADRSSAQEEFVIELKLPENDITSELKQIEKTTTPSTTKWRGSIKSRRFSEGETLKSIMKKYADEEGIEFLWYLHKDYIVKHNFGVEDTFVATLYQLGKAIDSDFEFEVKTFFCPKQRTAVITEKSTPYLRDNCVQARAY
ncbi:TcpQ domain-containing protein [Pseudoalteromonas tunicata]|jgi:hypothetical protein|uniref:Toxin co-regulated pilus biosynthesis protein Q C-terminal domain-containing protein n=1 Tax=Pseudoalteromonas tunicata D2 TaxID=87626 RepID=A4C949_9GAMM|nr:TcpQ domain-containing protein [Pseudoalteromonas tunicata]ATC93616.1 hypothetical protein PTUN_a0904 [Pseudoalteromonas tunicata]AXT29451.1 hypothetical protein D1819_00510 [Pseudoalteromonas tunicata]EAR29114.1 hypothetical protein PTD2_08719 [Pseudoalteromonas tunicata D2]MDP4983169.1 toxin co-regulated pilus biosynthesis Q family protein [Pseudoalteromonas tunicata]MDP5211831.1 TcpQ domain-containing protein [Pseudoalteromonas tunicata]